MRTSRKVCQELGFILDKKHGNSSFEADLCPLLSGLGKNKAPESLPSLSGLPCPRGRGPTTPRGSSLFSRYSVPSSSPHSVVSEPAPSLAHPRLYDCHDTPSQTRILLLGFWKDPDSRLCASLGSPLLFTSLIFFPFAPLEQALNVLPQEIVSHAAL